MVKSAIPAVRKETSGGDRHSRGFELPLEREPDDPYTPAFSRGKPKWKWQEGIASPKPGFQGSATLRPCGATYKEGVKQLHKACLRGGMASGGGLIIIRSYLS